jgi:hypothetical protein
MQKRFLKALLFGAILSVSTAFAGSGLLSDATNGAVIKAADAKALSNDEMKEVVGGAYSTAGYNWYFQASANSKIQVYARLTEGLGGNNVYIAGERYGATQNAGYKIYLTYTDPNVAYNNNSFAWDSHGWGINTPAVQATAASNQLIYSNSYINIQLARMYSF